VIHSLHDLALAHGKAIDSDSFPKIEQMRGSVEAHAEARLTEDGIEEGCGGTLSVRPSDQDGGVSKMRVSQPLHQGLYVRKSQLDPKFLQGEKIRQTLLICGMGTHDPFLV